MTSAPSSSRTGGSSAALSGEEYRRRLEKVRVCVQSLTVPFNTFMPSTGAPATADTPHPPSLSPFAGSATSGSQRATGSFRPKRTRRMGYPRIRANRYRDRARAASRRPTVHSHDLTRRAAHSFRPTAGRRAPRGLVGGNRATPATRASRRSVARGPRPSSGSGRAWRRCPDSNGPPP